MVLAITERYENIPEEERSDDIVYVEKDYKNVFNKLNITLFPVNPKTNLNKIIEKCDGLVVTGSCIDVNPKYYNQEVSEKTNLGSYDEYLLDSKLIEKFSSAKKPILGICGGMQAINVYFGGTLNQDIDNHNLKDAKHKIILKDGSFLHYIYEKQSIFVNSYHHQSVDVVAPGFLSSAMSEDNIVEGIEYENIIGVQWHPEKVIDLKFFENFMTRFY